MHEPFPPVAEHTTLAGPTRHGLHASGLCKAASQGALLEMESVQKHPAWRLEYDGSAALHSAVQEPDSSRAALFGAAHLLSARLQQATVDTASE